ncbi:uncharacterized protein BDR25DRAFT_363500 [Lindgomyces ingoldianus]|uniref:Uncharacterized protein n=1 Tax=Lindgomyces ingoldianus TaxID=673940 RepID=A0ACB6Q7M1_9PLEO|nr:uncharacterized protein BDR25DRAFT_363500 [Lindgomyces ingoldianus]KAF2462842.1 hypothetical protein BDR25DRAFT_363500 [Lindgomyces ingoldianus]
MGITNPGPELLEDNKNDALLRHPHPDSARNEDHEEQTNTKRDEVSLASLVQFFVLNTCVKVAVSLHLRDRLDFILIGREAISGASSGLIFVRCRVNVRFSITRMASSVLGLHLLGSRGPNHLVLGRAVHAISGSCELCPVNNNWKRLRLTPKLTCVAKTKFILTLLVTVLGAVNEYEQWISGGLIGKRSSFSEETLNLSAVELIRLIWVGGLLSSIIALILGLSDIFLPNVSATPPHQVQIPKFLSRPSSFPTRENPSDSFRSVHTTIPNTKKLLWSPEETDFRVLMFNLEQSSLPLSFLGSLSFSVFLRRLSEFKCTPPNAANSGSRSTSFPHPKFKQPGMLVKYQSTLPTSHATTPSVLSLSGPLERPPSWLKTELIHWLEKVADENTGGVLFHCDNPDRNYEQEDKSIFSRRKKLPGLWSSNSVASWLISSTCAGRKLAQHKRDIRGRILPTLILNPASSGRNTSYIAFIMSRISVKKL